ncbi:hypothetical protein NPS01_26490 [Nocardioides psychrotolerans]|uniref:Uncharacterized protein n=1 Tax=Nocardioides psychrotolerans TaxID=1005945 RepID=A0A1I3M1Q9_9ACTN|nr:hypothetical protein [Nocardioides psychrotolerans]GEP38986.1 hypothetical protein NPS01_26490 [Nocardioides psychrotolerans]SFI90636.1 hypothetical protein SAMN05216561_114156 [Nocardioides psychrotolerans]
MATAAALLLTSLIGLVGCGAEEGTAEPVFDVGAPTASGIDPALASVAADVERLAVRLEGFYRSEDAYPRDLAGALASLGPAGQELSEGNQIGTYVYDEDAVEFRLCVEAPGGAWATYDTAPMSVRETGEGGCPDV